MTNIYVPNWVDDKISAKSEELGISKNEIVEKLITDFSNDYLEVKKLVAKEIAEILLKNLVPYRLNGIDFNTVWKLAGESIDEYIRGLNGKV